MILLAGADLVLPDRILTAGTIAIEADRIVEILPGGPPSADGAARVDLRGHYLVPGFIDVHVHGVAGTDALDGPEAIGVMAARLPRYGVTAFCPTSVASTPETLDRMLRAVAAARASGPAGARVLPAHVESNFINPEYRGAQPADCLRRPTGLAGSSDYTGADVLAVIERARPDVGILTLAPELPGGLDLVRTLTGWGIRVSLGHSGATFDEALAAVAAGACHATHLFNRMSPMRSREPGLAGAVLHSDDVAAEIVCDGVHVHAAVVRVAIAAKHPSRVMAITDGTAASGLPRGATAQLGGRRITAREAAFLDDGTMAGSVLTMDGAFACLVTRVGLSPIDAATVCATTPARELGLHGHGVIAVGAVADLAVLDRDLRVVQTYVGGELIYSRNEERRNERTRDE
jgi:N-acetylglucosamine-6-phosphate deacetylase